MSDPCCPDPSDQNCPNVICDDRYAKLPRGKRMRLFGADGRCLREFHSEVGFVVDDGLGQGQIIKKDPPLHFPVSRSVQRGRDGSVIFSDGEPVEGAPPLMDYLVGVDDANRPWLLKGQTSVPSNVTWDGCQFAFEPKDTEEGYPWEDLISLDNTYEGCSAYEAVWVERQVKVCEGGQQTVKSYAFPGFRSNPRIPYGSVLPFAGQASQVPEGYRICNGDAVSIASYPLLFQIIGYAWGGSGDVFRIPDLRGQFLRGLDFGAEVDPDAGSRTARYAGGATGQNVGTYQSHAIQCHVHQGSGTNYEFFYNQTTTTHRGSRVVVADITVNSSPDPNDTGDMKDGDCGEVQSSSETRPTNAAVHFIIHTGCDRCSAS